MIQKLRQKFGPKDGTAHNPSKTIETSHKSAFDHAIITWEAPEYVKHEKGKTWFTVAGVIVLMLVLWGIWSHSWSTSVVFLLLAGVYYLAHTHEPRHLKITISEIGIKVGNACYAYANMRAFWVHYHPPFVKTLNFRTNERMFKEVTIQLDGQDPVPVRSYLARQISEWEGKEESFTDILTRVFKL